MFDGINLQTSLSFLTIYIFYFNNINLYFSLFIILYLLFFPLKIQMESFMGDSGLYSLAI